MVHTYRLNEHPSNLKIKNYYTRKYLWDKNETLLLFYPNFVMEEISRLQPPQMGAPY